MVTQPLTPEVSSYLPVFPRSPESSRGPESLCESVEESPQRMGAVILRDETDLAARRDDLCLNVLKFVWQVNSLMCWRPRETIWRMKRRRREDFVFHRSAFRNCQITRSAVSNNKKKKNIYLFRYSLHGNLRVVQNIISINLIIEDTAKEKKYIIDY